MRLRYDPAPLAHVVDDFEGDTSERLAGGVRLSAVADPDPEDEPLVYIHAFAVRRRTPKTDPALLCIYNGRPHQPLLWVKAGKYWHAARLETDRKRLLSRSGGCVRAARDKDGFQFYARVYHFRKWLLLLPLLLATLLLCLSLSLSAALVLALPRSSMGRPKYLARPPSPFLRPPMQVILLRLTPRGGRARHGRIWYCCSPPPAPLMGKLGATPYCQLRP